jgi:hypothetical protein
MHDFSELSPPLCYTLFAGWRLVPVPTLICCEKKNTAERVS